MPNDTTEWRYTAFSQEVVRSDGVLIAREVPPEFGKLVEATPALFDALDRLAGEVRATIFAFEHEMRQAMGNTNYHIISDRVTEACAVIARARQ